MISPESEWVSFESTGQSFEIRQISARDYYEATGNKEITGWEQTCELLAAAIFDVDGKKAFTAEQIADLPMPLFAFFSESVFRMNRLDIEDIKKKFGIVAGCLNSA